MVRLTLLAFSLLIFTGCSSHSSSEDKRKAETVGTIIYDTYIINNDPDDHWKVQCLENLNKESLIELVFEGVYEGKLEASDYFTGEKLPPSAIKEMEKKGVFKREQIGKIQFDEKWEWNKEAGTLTKEIRSMTIAYEVYNNFGELRGHKPIFKIEFCN